MGLKENLSKLTRLVSKKNKLEKEKLELEKQAKQNEILKRYLKVLENLHQVDLDLKEANNYIYESMLDENKDLIETTNFKITLKKPYTRVQFNTDLFLANYTPQSRMYKKYINIQDVKGNVNIKFTK